MNTFQLECFLTVAETLNFAKAAQILNITQPAVTKQIKSLEDELNVRLFKRSTRSVELTAEGRLLINDAETIIQTSNRAKRRFMGSREEVIPLSVGIRLTSHLKLLIKPLRELMARYENCRPGFTVETTSKLLRELYDEKLDMFLDIETMVTDYDSICFKELFKERIFCVCTDKFPVYDMETVTCEQLRQFDRYPIIFMSAPKTQKEVTEGETALIGSRSETMVRFCTTSEELSLLAQAGCGMAIMPEMILPDNSSVRKIPIVDCPEISFGIYHKSSVSNEAARSFVEILKKYAPSMKYNPEI